LVYVASTPLASFLTARFEKRGVIFIGYIVCTVAFFFIGPSKILGFDESPGLTILGLAIMGSGAGLIVIPVMPEMIDAIEEKYPGIDETVMHNMISGMFVAAQGVGETLGPVLGSIFEKTSGFRSS
jgi:MFS family permease